MTGLTTKQPPSLQQWRKNLVATVEWDWHSAQELNNAGWSIEVGWSGKWGKVLLSVDNLLHSQSKEIIL